MALAMAENDGQSAGLFLVMEEGRNYAVYPGLSFRDTRYRAFWK
jgi:hypothetical protein